MLPYITYMDPVGDGWIVWNGDEDMICTSHPQKNVV
jgi:hypothetical protein